MKRLINHAKNAHSHLKKHHKHYMIGGFGLYGLAKTFVFMFSFLASFAYFGQHTTTLAAWTSNNDFIEQNFWDTTQSSGDLVSALYGTGIGDITAYTDHRSGYDGSCSLAGGNMNVEYILPGNGTIPENLTGNIVYVLNSGDYLIPYSAGVMMSGCNTIIGSGDVYLYSTGKISGGGMINNLNNQFGIIDNVRVNGTGDGAGGSHTGNDYGILFNGADSWAINNSQSYNNDSHGIYFLSSDNGIINNSQFYNNNYYGIYFNGSDNGIINNSQFYNNNNYGIWFGSSDNGVVNNSQFYNNNNGIYYSSSNNGTINNSQSYNNNNNGIQYLSSNSGTINNSQSYNNNNGIYYSSSNNGTINNSQSYNNNNYGIQYLSSNSGTINNSQIYNNSNIGIFVSGNLTGNKYYGELKLFDNINGDFLGTDGYDGVLTGGSSGDPEISGLGREDGYIDTNGCMTCDWYTNPINSLNVPLMNTGDYSTCERKGYTGDWISTGEVNYIYGSLISKQTTGVVYSGTDLVYSSLFYDPTKFIAEINKTGIYTGNYSCNCESINTSRDNNNFITQTGFWDDNPTYCEIISALYGTGIGDTTAYTDHRSGYDGSCSLASGNMNVEYILPGNGTIPENLTENTIYVLNSGDYLIPYSGGVNMFGCNTIIGSGEVYLYSTGKILDDGMINNAYNQYGIVDNVKIDGLSGHTGGENRYGINFNGADNGTVNSVESYNNTYGIFYFNLDNGIINNSQSYNNLIGIQYQNSNNGVINNSQTYDNRHGIRFRSSNSGIINNSQSYNNNDGLFYNFSDNGIINNSQSYNNNNGIQFNSSNNGVINNSQSYNNDNGIQFNSSNNGIINNSQSYNNNNGIRFNLSNGGVINNSQSYNNSNYELYLNATSTGAKYYGENWFSISGSGSNITSGASTDFPFLGWTTGVRVTRDISWDYITNPINTSGDYLSSWSGSFDSLRLNQPDYDNTITEEYSYGSGILTQIQPVIFSGANLVASGSFDSDKYIGSDVIKVTGDLVTIPEFTRHAGLVVTGLSTDLQINRYSIFGNLNYFNIGQGINTSTGIELTNGDGKKLIINQLFGNNYFATHFQRDTFLDQTAPSIVDLTSPIDNTDVSTGNVDFLWDVSVDTGVGLSGYYMELYKSGTLILSTGIIDLTGTSVELLEDNNYQRKVYSTDKLGNTGNWSNTGFFTIKDYTCDLPRGGTIASGESITAYQNSSVACGSSCLSQTVTCNNGVLSGAYTNNSCSVATCPTHGGGGSSLQRDDCPDGDNSASYYDGTCGSHSSAGYDICDIDQSSFSNELKGAYLSSYRIGITTMCPIGKAKLDGYLKRDHFAKMISEFAINVLGKNPQIGKSGCDKFNDLEGITKELKNYVKLSCELGLLGMHSDGKTPKDSFKPADYVTRAEFGTAFSRLLYGDKYNTSDNPETHQSAGYWYKPHLQALKSNGIMTKIDGGREKKLELRGYVMLMMQRVDIDGSAE